MVMPKKKKCSVCTKLSEYVQCAYCETPQCFTCADISLIDANVLKKHKSLKFECNNCAFKENDEKRKSDKHSASNNNDLLTVITLLQEQVKKLQDSLDSIKQGNETKSKCTSSDMDDVINEMEERKKRSKNIIIYDIQESKNTDPEDRKKHDLSKFKEILETIEIQNVKPTRIVRLGNIDKDKSSSRPMLVTVENKSTAISILKNANIKHMKNMKNDLTPIQRSKLKELRERLAEKQGNGENDWSIKYVRGIPQLWKINQAAKK
uniref:Uncharacterized protein n=1 Tax=Cacopsylla melanoneura TaxID=428564 RepID=A0A8D8UH26_9HEMI